MSPKEPNPPKPSLFAKTAMTEAAAGLLAPLSPAAADSAPQSAKGQPDPGAPIPPIGLANIGSGQGLRVKIVLGDPGNVTATLVAADGSVLAQQRGQVSLPQSHVPSTLEVYDGASGQTRVITLPARQPDPEQT